MTLRVGRIGVDTRHLGATFAIAVAVLVSACSPTETVRAPEPSDTVAEPLETPAPVVVPLQDAPAVTPGPLPDQNPQPQVGAPEVKLAPAAFAIGSPTGSLVRFTPTAEFQGKVRFGVQMYLQQLDSFRRNMASGVSAPKPFADVVAQALRETSAPGVERRFDLVSLRIDAAYRKPWGSDAMADVTVTIRDTVVSGNAPDETETGRLRLAGENRFSVIDGWDSAHAKWFNGLSAPSRDRIEQPVTYTVANYLWSESWVPGTQNWSYSQFWGVSTRFAKWHDGIMAAFDHEKVTRRTFETVTAAIERYDPTTELGDGVITVRVRGTEVTADASGATTRTPFERVVRAYMPWWGFAAGRTVVVDEFSAGAWRSGGDLALKELDREFG